jgi:GTP-binding protein
VPTPLVAIVGRPNVGKSTLFNRLLRQRKAIVESEPGVTRDRLYAEATWAGRTFLVVDTGGLDWEAETAIQAATTRQAEVAMTGADVIVFVVDATAGLTPADEAVGEVLRRGRKPVVVAVNKVDDPTRGDQVNDFYRLGLNAELVAVSAFHGTGTGDLLDAIVAKLPPGQAPEAEAEKGHEEAAGASFDVPQAEPAGPARIAVVGRPNVGKSSLVNALLGEERVIVADEPGTTRDAIDVPFSRDGVSYVLIDTAGLRKRARVKAGVERYSVLRTLRAIDRADVVALVLDASRPLAEQDKKVAGGATESGRALVLAVNKWDLVPKDETTYLGYEEVLRKDMYWCQWAPVVFVSAKTGHNLGRLLESIGIAAANHRKRVATAEVTRVFRDAVALNPPPPEGQHRLKVGYVTQASVGPPTFVFFVNRPTLVTDTYKRYLEGKAREAWGFQGTPIRLVFRGKKSS